MEALLTNPFVQWLLGNALQIALTLTTGGIAYGTYRVGSIFVRSFDIGQLTIKNLVVEMHTAQYVSAREITPALVHADVLQFYRSTIQHIKERTAPEITHAFVEATDIELQKLDGLVTNYVLRWTEVKEETKDKFNRFSFLLTRWVRELANAEKKSSEEQIMADKNEVDDALIAFLETLISSKGNSIITEEQKHLIRSESVVTDRKRRVKFSLNPLAHLFGR